MRLSQIRKLIVLVVLLTLMLWAITMSASFLIEYSWWREVGQVDTWITVLWYSSAPTAVGTLIALLALWATHSRGLHFAGIRRQDSPLYFRLMPVGLAIVAILFASASIDYWKVMQFVGSRRITLPADAWKDPVFSRPLPFYLFDLPFYSQVLGFLIG